MAVYCKIRCSFRDPMTEMRALGSIKFMLRNDDQVGGKPQITWYPR